MKKILLILALVSMNLYSEEKKNETINLETENIEIKTFTTLKEAAENYVEVMQLATDNEALENIQSINPSVDNYVLNSNNNELIEKWAEVNLAIIGDIEYSVARVNELNSLGDVKIAILEYDKEKMKEYMEKNSNKYYVMNEETKVNEISVEAYVDLLYEYLSTTSKVQVGLASIDFVKGPKGWKIIEKKK